MPGGTSLGYAGPNQAELVDDDGVTIENNLLGKSREITGTDTTAFIRAADGTLLARKAPGRVWSYYVLDNLGSVIGTTNAAGAVTETYDYDPDSNPWRRALRIAVSRDITSRAESDHLAGRQMGDKESGG